MNSSCLLQGVFAINKPVGISSQKAIQIIKKWLILQGASKKIKVGHAGTLDPLAKGVLVVAVSRKYTRNIDNFVSSEKEYLVDVTLGKISATDDSEGPIKDVFVEKTPSKKEVELVVKEFVGNITQIPPVYSAIKIDGKEAYKRVRNNENIEMSSREVFVKDIELLKYDYPKLNLKVTSGKGVYMRALARDIGEKLDVGGYMSALTRIRVGNFCIQDAFDISIFE